MAWATQPWAEVYNMHDVRMCAAAAIAALVNPLLCTTRCEAHLHGSAGPLLGLSRLSLAFAPLPLAQPPKALQSWQQLKAGGLASASAGLGRQQAGEAGGATQATPDCW